MRPDQIAITCTVAVLALAVSAAIWHAKHYCGPNGRPFPPLRPIVGAFWVLCGFGASLFAPDPHRPVVRERETADAARACVGEGVVG